MDKERKELVEKVAQQYGEYLKLFGLHTEHGSAAYFEGCKSLFTTWEEWDLLWNELSEPKLMAMLVPQMAMTVKNRKQLVATMSRCPKNHGASRIVRQKMRMNFHDQIPELKEEVSKFFAEHETELPPKAGILTLRQWVLQAFFYNQKGEDTNPKVRNTEE